MTEAERALIRNSQNGDKGAFGELVVRFGDYVFSVVFRLVNEEHASEDIVQETFIKAWQKIKRYKFEKGKFTTWLYVIASRLALDYLRGRKKNVSIGVESDIGSESVSELETKELGAYIRKVCDQLSLTQKLVFVLRDLEELSVDEVVKITGFSEKKIKDNLYVARQRVRVRINAFLNS
ncbi:RNA polymerase sigma factor [Carboxylicivirga sp. N1Y90]|uniref:RNA polymerase sigma factor n=1 Tax=Carboxylicivirga fragile TaxID=3417571 RepID=UPI003D352FC2|nr:sigma-70 family RNA polymerase sigma factor [Marinilabiliaceae bacterium N1Y90]